MQRKPSMVRRSSTHRSLGMRSDWDSAAPSEYDDDTRPGTANGDQTPNGTEPSGRRWTIFEEETSRKARESADEHVHNYVQDQLKRLMQEDAPVAEEDELAAGA